MVPSLPCGLPNCNLALTHRTASCQTTCPRAAEPRSHIATVTAVTRLRAVLAHGRLLRTLTMHASCRAALLMHCRLLLAASERAGRCRAMYYAFRCGCCGCSARHCTRRCYAHLRSLSPAVAVTARHSCVPPRSGARVAGPTSRPATEQRQAVEQSESSQQSYQAVEPPNCTAPPSSGVPPTALRVYRPRCSCDDDRARQGPGPEAATRPPHTTRTAPAPRLSVELPAYVTFNAAALSAPVVTVAVAAAAAIGAARSLQRVTLTRQQSCRYSGLPLSARVSICRSASAVCHLVKPAAPVYQGQPTAVKDTAMACVPRSGERISRLQLCRCCHGHVIPLP